MQIAESRGAAPSRSGAFYFDLVWCLLFLLSLIGIYWVYSLGAGFGYAFDDEINLSGLTQVRDLESALLFVFSGNAGPIGRPLALASFLINLPSWPSNHIDFLRTNVLIHLLNAALLVWLAFRLQRYLPWQIKKPEWFALAVGLIWAINPVLISSNLMIVQRMTSLSATFCLIGLIAFVIGRQHLAVHRIKAIVLMSSGIVGATFLALLCKENGCLLPLFALAIEVGLIAPARTQDPDAIVALPRWWLRTFLLFPLVVTVGYLLNVAWQSGGAYAGREFNLIERLLTENRILFAYLKQIVLPVRSEIGPYHDDYTISHSLFDPPTTILAIVGWLALAFIAFRSLRSNWRLWSFAFMWFAGGHLLESTSIGLELYFEHRNYMPSMGIIFSLVALFWHPLFSASARLLLLALLASNHYFVFKETIFLWGEPRIAGKLWHKEHPASLRALQTHAAYLRVIGDTQAIVALIDAAPEELAKTTEYQVYRLKIYCQLMPENATSDVIPGVNSALRSAVIKTPSAIELLSLNEMIKDGTCSGIAEVEYIDMIASIVSSGKTTALAKSLSHEELANLWIDRRVIDKAMFHLEEAYRLRPSLQVVAKMVAVLESAGLYDGASQVLIDARAQAPFRPYVYGAWMNAFDELAHFVEKERMRSTVEDAKDQP